MKTRLIMRAVLTAVLTLVATTASAHDFEFGELCYNINSDGTASVTYDDFNPYIHYLMGEIEIPSTVKHLGTTYTVTAIGDHAFDGCGNITSITIPNSITAIGTSAFSGCSGLSSITIPNSVTAIGDRAFSGCDGLSSVTIPNSVTTIGNSAFESCDCLSSVTIPNSVIEIGNNAFYYCTNLSRVNISSIEAWLGIKFSNSYSNPLRYAHHLYLNGEEVKDLDIPNSVNSIGDFAFYGCSDMTSVTIPNTVTSIGNNAFNECSGLSKVDISSIESWLGIAFNSAESNPLYYAKTLLLNGEEVKELIVPNTFTSIGNYAFVCCSSLTRATIPNSVTEIGNSAFSDCINLLDVEIPESILSICGNALENTAYLKSLPDGLIYFGNILFKYNGVMPDNSTIIIKEGTTNISEYAFNKCSGLCNIIIPTSVDKIGEYAFYGCTGLTRVSIPNNVTSIEKYVFYNCRSLTSIAVPNNVTSIGDYAFCSCKGLKSVSIGNSVETIGNYAFQGCSGLTSVTIPNSVNSIGESAFYGCSGLASISIPNSVSSISNSAFSGCSGLTSISIPNSVTSIGNYAFSGCSGLTSVTIPNSVTSIGSFAFNNCSGLTRLDITSLEAWLGIKFSGSTSNPLFYAKHLFLNGEEVKDLVIPNSVTSINDCAFYNCSGLTSVTIPNSVTSIGDYAFVGCSGLTSVSIGNSVTSIGNVAFAGCSSLSNVTIGNSVTSIGERAFERCSGLASITIPKSVNSIGVSAFEGCEFQNIFYNAENCQELFEWYWMFSGSVNSITIGKDVKKMPNHLFFHLSYISRVISLSVEAPSCDGDTFSPDTYSSKLYIPSDGEFNYLFHNVWSNFSSINNLEKPITGITLSESDVTIKVGETKTITATTAPEDATIPDAYYWSSSNNNVATVNANGIITAVGEGTAIITANSYDGGEIVASCNVTVKSDKATSITLNFTELSLFEKTETATLKYTILPEDASVRTAEWVISDEAVIQYKKNADGSLLIGGKSAGTATVTARTTDGSNLSATCVVTVYPVATNVNQIKPGTNKVNFGLQGVKMHDGVLYACTTAESVNKSTPTLHSNDPGNMAPYEDRNFADFDQRDWVAISGLEDGFVGKELSYPFVANFADGILTPSETITATADATAYPLNTFRAENILHGGYSNYAEGDYTAYYVPARVNEVANFMGFIETVGGVKYLYSNNAYGRTDGEGIKVENCTIADNSDVYNILEGILVADASTKAGVKIIMLDYVGEATGVEGVDAAEARIYSAGGNIIIAATEDGESAVYDFTGRLIKSVPVVAGDNTAVPVMPGCYIVRTGVKKQSVVVK